MTRSVSQAVMNATRDRRPARRRSRPRLEALESRRLLTIFVDTLDDSIASDSHTSLREAIAVAASEPGDDLIAFADGLAGTIPLSLGALVLDDSSGTVAIEATPGAITIDARGASRVMSVADGTTATLTGLTLTGGMVERCGCGTTRGGGISNQGDLTLVRSTVSGNKVFGNGGGIANDGVLSLIDSTVTGNTAASIDMPPYGINGSRGGGIWNGATMTIRASTISGNVAERGFGGGIESGYGASSTLTNSTVSGNAVIEGDGGGLRNYAGTLVLTNSTVTGNTAGSRGGGVFSRSYYGVSTTLINSIIAGNTRTWDGKSDNVGGVSPTFDSAGNLVGPSEAFLDPAANLVGVRNPRLGPLADNGGPTLTHLPLPGSPAIDAGITLDDVTTDQRGVIRPTRARADIGAVEVRFEISAFRVQTSRRQRSFIRYLEVAFGERGDVQSLIDQRRVRLTRYALDGSGPGLKVNPNGVMSANGGRLLFDFGARGLGNTPGGPGTDGYYVLSFDLDGDGTFETERRFYRLHGDVNGDRVVDQADLFSIASAFLRAPQQLPDVNGDGSVDLQDYRQASRNLGARLDPSLVVDA